MAASTTDVDAQTQRRWIASRSVFFVGVVLLIVLSLALVWAALTFRIAEGLGHTFVAAFGLDPGVEETPFWVYPLTVYVTYFVLPVVIFLPILLPLALSWKTPRRVVVFRRFNTPNEAKRLRKIAARHFGRVGHVFTLADSQIRRSLFVRIPGLLGQLSFLHFRPRRIHDARGLTGLEHLLDQRWRLNINWLVSYGKIFPTATSDEYWQRVVSALLDKADLVVMDLSGFSASMAWEVSECQRRELLSRTIFLVSREKSGDSTQMLAGLAHSSGSGTAPTAFEYDANDVEDPTALRERIEEATGQLGSSSRTVSGWQIVVTMASTLVISLGLAAAGVFVSAPFLFPQLAGLYSPVRSQAWAAYRMTASDEILSRLIAEDREDTLSTLVGYAEDPASAVRHRAIDALSRFGDERHIAVFIEWIGKRSPEQIREDEERLKSLIKSRDFEADALTRLVTRLGRPALDPLLHEMAHAPLLPYYDDLYNDFIHVHAKDSPPDLMVPLLGAPNQAARFSAALELAPRNQDPRVIPILVEIVHATRADVGLGLYAQELLSKWPRDVAIDWQKLDPYIFGNDVAAERAARLAFDATDGSYLANAMERVPDGKGQSLLRYVISRARISDDPRDVTRGHALLARARPAWTTSLLADSDVAIRVLAAYAQAERGNTSAAAVVLAASRLKGTCETLLFMKSECNPHAADAIAVFDLMREKLRAPVRVAVNPDAMTGLPQGVLRSFIQLLLASGDVETLRELFAVLRPSTRNPESDALRDIGESVDRPSLRLLVRALPSEASADRVALLAGLADGLQTDFCLAAKAEGRRDLLSEWKDAGYECEGD